MCRKQAANVPRCPSPPMEFSPGDQEDRRRLTCPSSLWLARALGEVGVNVSRASIPKAGLAFQESMAGPARDCEYAHSQSGWWQVVRVVEAVSSHLASWQGGQIVESRRRHAVLAPRKRSHGGRKMFPFPVRALAISQTRGKNTRKKFLLRAIPPTVMFRD